MDKRKRVHVVVAGDGTGYRFEVHGDPSAVEGGAYLALSFEDIAASPTQPYEQACMTYDGLVSGGVDVLVHTSATGVMG